MSLGTISRFERVLARMGSNIICHREDGGTACPCLTPEGFRDPTWHLINVGYPVCNEQGYLVTATEFQVKGMVQPALTGYSRASQRANDLLGDVQRGDKIGVFPCSWNGNTLDFEDWSEAGEDYLYYDGKRYTVVAADKLADVNGAAGHHYEVGLRLLTAERPTEGVPPPYLYLDDALYPNDDLYPVGA